jgi:hypothetical protein
MLTNTVRFPSATLLPKLKGSRETHLAVRNAMAHQVTAEVVWHCSSRALLCSLVEIPSASNALMKSFSKIQKAKRSDAQFAGRKLNYLWSFGWGLRKWKEILLQKHIRYIVIVIQTGKHHISHRLGTNWCANNASAKILFTLRAKYKSLESLNSTATVQEYSLCWIKYSLSFKCWGTISSHSKLNRKSQVPLTSSRSLASAKSYSVQICKPAWKRLSWI